MYLPVDSAEGSTTLDIAGETDGTLRDCSADAPGVVGNAIAFDKEGSVVLVPGGALAERLNGAKGVTVEFWVAPGTEL